MQSWARGAFIGISSFSVWSLEVSSRRQQRGSVVHRPRKKVKETAQWKAMEALFSSALTLSSGAPAALGATDQGSPPQQNK